MLTNKITHLSEGGDMLDALCRSRRRDIQESITGHQPCQPLPLIEYTVEEDSLWQRVISRLGNMHPDVACSRYLQAADLLPLPTSRVPSLDEISVQLEKLTGFRLLPAADLVPARDFYTSFTESYFYSTMYLRCPGVPLYSPDPDILHELVGHAVMLGDPLFADMYRRFGQAVSSARSQETLDAISQVFWFTMETGLVREGDQLRAYGAALLSSSGELESIRNVSIEEFSIEKMTSSSYDIYAYQPVLFEAPSIEWLFTEISRFLDRTS